MSESLAGASQESYRYFYTEPLPAAVMAKQFGMRFEAFFVPIGQFRDLHIRAIESHIGCNHLQIDGRFYLHPDSLPQLAARLGDRLGNGDSVFTVSRRLDARDQEDTIRHAQYLLAHGWQIERRDGKPFFWPERAAA